MNKYNGMSKTARGIRVAKLAGALIAGIVLTGCEPITCALGINHDAKVTFTNSPGGSTSMFGTLDGSNVTGTLGDGATSSKIDTNSGSHSIGFTNTVGGSAPCSTAFPSLKACATTNFSCT